MLHLNWLLLQIQSVQLRLKEPMSAFKKILFICHLQSNISYEGIMKDFITTLIQQQRLFMSYFYLRMKRRNVFSSESLFLHIYSTGCTRTGSSWLFCFTLTVYSRVLWEISNLPMVARNSRLLADKKYFPYYESSNFEGFYFYRIWLMTFAAYTYKFM
jgi:hypothetical protein